VREERVERCSTNRSQRKREMQRERQRNKERKMHREGIVKYISLIKNFFNF